MVATCHHCRDVCLLVVNVYICTLLNQIVMRKIKFECAFEIEHGLGLAIVFVNSQPKNQYKNAHWIFNAMIGPFMFNALIRYPYKQKPE